MVAADVTVDVAIVVAAADATIIVTMIEAIATIDVVVVVAVAIVRDVAAAVVIASVSVIEIVAWIDENENAAWAKEIVDAVDVNLPTLSVCRTVAASRAHTRRIVRHRHATIMPNRHRDHDPDRRAIVRAHAIDRRRDEAPRPKWPTPA